MMNGPWGGMNRRRLDQLPSLAADGLVHLASAEGMGLGRRDCRLNEIARPSGDPGPGCSYFTYTSRAVRARSPLVRRQW